MQLLQLIELARAPDQIHPHSGEGHRLANLFLAKAVGTKLGLDPKAILLPRDDLGAADLDQEGDIAGERGGVRGNRSSLSSDTNFYEVK